MKRAMWVCLCLLLCLSSCASMLEREYTVAERHEENPLPQSDTYRAETYPALRAGLLSYLEEGLETGALRVPATYSGNLTVDLERVKRQLMEEEPLGCYALRDLTFHTSKIIAYYEVTATFDYRVTTGEIKAVVNTRDEGALDAVVKKALSEREDGFTVLLYPNPDPQARDLIGESIQRLGQEDPGLASPPIETEITYYPENVEANRRTVAEVRLHYSESGGGEKLSGETPEGVNP